MRITLNVWRQKSASEPGQVVGYVADNVSPDMSFLEMLDVVNEGLVAKGEEPIAFEHDCREGICGCCGIVVNGIPHGPERGTTVCQLHMRKFKDGDVLTLEPWRARAFPVLRDLVVDRAAFDRVVQAGGFISVSTGSPSDANAIPVPKATADLAMDAAACIGCGACVAACPNGAAMLFVGAFIAKLNLLPQGQVERDERVRNMVAVMEDAGFGGCTNFEECEAVCPKEIGVHFIAAMNRDYLRAFAKGEGNRSAKSDGGA